MNRDNRQFAEKPAVAPTQTEQLKVRRVMKGDFASGMRTMPVVPEGPDYARGARTRLTEIEGPDYARGMRTEETQSGEKSG